MSEDAELGMLRAFYRSWIAFHKIPRDKLHRRKQETAAQIMLDNAHDLQNYYKSQQPEKPLLEVVGGKS